MLRLYYKVAESSLGKKFLESLFWFIAISCLNSALFFVAINFVEKSPVKVSLDNIHKTISDCFLITLCYFFGPCVAVVTK